jgi:ADP-ribose pyrophosphatase YjhB (NUDIX family)
VTPHETRVGAYAVCLDGTERMLLCRIGPGYPAAGEWTLPGGGLELGEHPAVGAIRELSEETGYEGRIVELLEVASHAVPAAERVMRKVDLHVIFILYRVEINGGALRDEVGGSTDTAAWIAAADMGDLRLVPIVDLARRLVMQRTLESVT